MVVSEVTSIVLGGNLIKILQDLTRSCKIL